MTAVKIPFNVGPKVSADVCKGDRSGPMRTAMATGGGWVKNGTFCDIFIDEPLSRNYFRNLSRKNAKPYRAAKIAASRKLSRNLC